MIKKPENYEQLKNNYETLNPGGHKCIIKVAKETKDANGKEILVIEFDTSHEDSQPYFFTNIFVNTAPNKAVWPYSGQRTFWMDSEWFESNLTKMTGAIEKSNPDVNIWKDDALDLPSLVNLKVGVVFGVEQYTKEDHSIGASVKPRYFCGYDEAEAQAIPKVKEAKPRAEAPAADYGFVDVAEDNDEGLPFK